MGLEKLGCYVAKKIGTAGRLTESVGNVQLYEKVGANGVKTFRSYSGAKPMAMTKTHVNEHGVSNYYNINFNTGEEVLTTKAPNANGCYIMDITSSDGSFIRRWFSAGGQQVQETQFNRKPSALLKIFNNFINRAG